MLLDHPSDGPAAIRTHIGAIFVSLELSRSTWLVTSLSPGKGEKMSKHSVTAGDVAGLMKLFAELRRKAEARTGESYPIITIQEAGLDGFWLHRVLQQNGIESHVVDPASIAMPRRRRRAKTDRRFSPTSAANHGSVRWSLPPRPKRRIGGGFVASARH
jgi:transposase